MVPTIILFVSLTYVFFTLLLFVRNQVSKLIKSIQPLPIGAPWLRGVSVVTYILSCLIITKLETLILYDGVFIAIYVASILGNIASLWFILKKGRNSLDFTHTQARTDKKIHMSICAGYILFDIIGGICEQSLKFFIN